MNLVTFLNRGAAYAPTPAEIMAKRIADSAEQARAQWLNALMVDQTRAWMSLGEKQPEILDGMATMLTIAGFVDVYDTKSTDTPALRVIRGAISAAAQCAQAGDVIRTEDARAFSAACRYAHIIITNGSVSAIIHAAESIRRAAGLV